uniref:Uncharacterized protein n=1 Tax=Rhipicephalus zambeziensis TaxID=60191 RepID=A0A224YKE6_9ACAR
MSKGKGNSVMVGPISCPPKKTTAERASPYAFATLGSLNSHLSDTMKSTVGSRMQHNETIGTQNKQIHRYCIVPSYNYLEKYHATKTRHEKKKKKKKKKSKM